MFDPSVRAQDDFFRHVNGTWLKSAVIPPDKSHIGSFESIREKIEAQLRGLVEDAAQRRDDADARRIGDLYTSFMDEAAVEKRRPRRRSPTSWRRSTRCRRPTRSAPRSAGSTASASTCRSASPSPRRPRHDQVHSVARPGRPRPARPRLLPGRRRRQVRAGARAVRRLPDAPARALGRRRRCRGVGAGGARRSRRRSRAASGRGSRTAIRSRPTTASTLAALAPLAPGFDWPAWLAATGLAGKTGDVIVDQPSYLGVVAAQLTATPLPVWKAYLRTHLLHAYAPYLGKAFVAARFEFSGTALRGTIENEPRWKRGVALVQQSAGEALGKLYVDTLLPAGVEGAHGKARRQPARRLPREHRFARLDEPGDEEGGAGQAGDVHGRRSATRSAGSTTARSRSAATTWSATSSARAPSSTSASSPSSASRSTATSGA